MRLRGFAAALARPHSLFGLFTSIARFAACVAMLLLPLWPTTPPRPFRVLFTLSADPPAACPPAAACAAAPAAEEKTDFDVVLVDAGSSKIGVIKVVREITGLGLKEAKEKVDTAPQTIKEAAPEAEAPKAVLEGAKKEDAEAAKEKLEAAGAKVELK